MCLECSYTKRLKENNKYFLESTAVVWHNVIYVLRIVARYTKIAITGIVNGKKRDQPTAGK